MRISEMHALGRQLVQVRGGDSRFLIVGTEVPIPHVIDEDEEDVGFRGGRQVLGEDKEED